MKILLINYRYYLSGGPERYMFHVKELLEKHHHEVIPFAVHNSQNAPSEYEKYFVDPIGGRDAVYYEDCRKTPRVIWQLFWRSVYSSEVEKAIRREIEEVRPDIVYILHFVNKLSPSVIVGAKKMGLPVVVRLSDYFLLCPRFDFLFQKRPCEDCLKYGYRMCVKRKCVKNSFFASCVRVLSMKAHSLLGVYKNVDAFITPSHFLKEKLTEYGFETDKIRYIPTFTEISPEDELSQTGSYGLYFGRISEEKDVETLVKAYELLPDRHLKIAGNDSTEYALKLKAYIESRGISNVTFLGFQQGENLKRVIQGARFTVLPSIWYDNLPNAVLESFRYAKPILASAIGSLLEMVEDGVNGFLFPPGDSEALAEKIRLLDDDELVRRMGRRGRERLESEFSEERHYRELLSLFHEAMKDSPTAETFAD